MSMLRPLFAALTALAAPIAPARADILGTAPVIHGDPFLGVCQLHNHGSPTIAFVLVRIMRDTGAAVPPVGNTCGTSLAPNKGCLISAPIAIGQRYVCKVITTNKATLAFRSSHLHSSLP